MLGFSGNLRVYLAVEPCDMRKSFNGLYALAEETLKEDLKSGVLLAFTSHRGNRIKLLYHNGTGVWVMSKRLEQGTFSWSTSNDAGTAKLSLTPEALVLLTDEIDLRDGCRWAQYE